MLKKILIYIFWVILAVYMLFSLVIIPNIPDNNQCKGVLITVDNDENGNLSKENITELLDKEGLNPYGYIIDSIRCTVIENCINEYYNLSVGDRHKLLNAIIDKIIYEKSENGRWNEEARSSFILELFLKI